MKMHYRAPEKLLVLGPFPPPVHGFSTATARLADFAQAEGIAVTRHDQASKLRTNLLRLAGNFWLTITGCGVILRFVLNGGRRVSIGVNGNFGLIFTLILVLTGRLLRREMTLHHHTYGYIHEKSELMRAVVAAGGTVATHVFLSSGMAEAFKAVYGQAHTAVVSNAYMISPPPLADVLVSRGHPLRLGHLSNLGREKGLYRFIDLCRELARAGLPFEAHLAGPVSLAEDRAAIEAAVQAISGFSYSGPLYGADKDAFFAGLDLFVFPTEYRFEAQPIVLYEAMARGVPVLSVDRGCIREQANGCLKVFDDLESFSREAPTLVADLAAKDQSDRLDTRRKARDKFEVDAEEGRQTLRSLLRLTYDVSAL